MISGTYFIQEWLESNIIDVDEDIIVHVYGIVL